MKFFTVPQPESTLSAKAFQEPALSEVPVIYMAFLPTAEPAGCCLKATASHYLSTIL